MQRLSLSVALAALALASGCATPWQTIETKHFRLYTDSDFGYEETLRSLENGHAILASSFFSNTELPRKVDVLFIDDVPFNSMMGAYRTGAALAKAPGATGIGDDGLLILRPNATSLGSNVPQQGTLYQDPVQRAQNPTFTGAGQDRRPDTNAAGRAAIEMLTHIYLQKAMPNAPLWFHEGLARYFREARYNVAGNDAIACLGFTPIVAVGEVLLEPDKLWSATWEQYGSEYRSWLPYTGQMFVDYVLHGSSGAYRDKLGPLVTVLAEGKPSADAVQTSLGWNDASLSPKLKEHAQDVQQLAGKSQARGGCPIGFRISSAEMPDTGQPAKSEADQQKIQALIAAIENLPERDGYQPYYPLDVIERAGKGKKK
jgi:hypothetical protein